MKNRIFRSIAVTGIMSAITALAICAITCAVKFNLDISLLVTMLGGSLLACTLLCVISAKLISKKIVDPIEQLNPEAPEAECEYTEISGLLHKINRQNELISRQMDDLRRRQIEFSSMTEYMSEGIILIDNKSEILFYNKSACDILGVQNVKEGEHFISLNRSHSFVSAVSSAFNGQHAEASLNIGQRKYRVFANPVQAKNQISGTIIIILDITEQALREDMRREFSSNVSHELKTPLTTISGISELFINGIVAQDDIPSFAKKIYDESARLLTLINDIIKLSRLDETDNSVFPDRIDLSELAQEITERLAIPAKKGEIAITLDTEPAEITGNRSILSEMVYNLCDNAIKYNKKGGNVKVCVKNLLDAIVLTVSDNGIGIPSEHQSRIFERFYRVDKSHSKEIGGTGLGLSIVKHAAEYHKATVTLQSTVDVGTEITVTFPKQ